MRIRLVHSHPGTPATPAVSEEHDSWRLFFIGVGTFLVLKLPLLFTSQNPEELRDFDHFLRTASGGLPFRDYVWLYGPLTPLVMGTLMKVLPTALLSVRVLSLFFWTAAAGFYSLMLHRWIRNSTVYFLGILFVTGGFGYHTYSHNHILPTLGTVACVHFFIKYWLDDDLRAHRYSFLGALICFLCRPVLMGYGVLGCWFALSLWRERDRRGISTLIAPLIVVLGCLLTFYAIYGRGFISCLAPLPWAILPSKDYPNLHYLVPHIHLGSSAELKQSFVSVRGALETALFYLHYFIWPTFIFTACYFQRTQRNVVAATLCTLFALVGSLDLLHYGFSDPLREQAMWVRGQYFFSLTALALFLYFVPIILTATTERKVKVGLALGLLVVGAWSYIPWFAGTSYFLRFKVNEYHFPALRGVFTHTDRKPMLEAIRFINDKCKPSDRVVVPQYDPGLSRLLKCPDLFERDAYLFTRAAEYPLQAYETPYAPQGNITNGDLTRRVIAQSQPRFYLMQGLPDYVSVCSQKGWQSMTFGKGANGRQVCWGPETERPLTRAIPE